MRHRGLGDGGRDDGRGVRGGRVERGRLGGVGVGGRSAVVSTVQQLYSRVLRIVEAKELNSNAICLWMLYDSPVFFR